MKGKNETTEITNKNSMKEDSENNILLKPKSKKGNKFLSFLCRRKNEKTTVGKTELDFPDYVSIDSDGNTEKDSEKYDTDGNLLEENFFSNDHSEANNKNGVFNFSNETDVVTTNRPLPAIPLSDDEIFKRIRLNSCYEGIKEGLTSDYVDDESQSELVYKVFVTMVLHFDQNRGKEILKKLFNDFKIYLENERVQIQGQSSSINKEHTNGNQNESSSVKIKDIVSESHCINDSSQSDSLDSSTSQDSKGFFPQRGKDQNSTDGPSESSAYMTMTKR